MNDEYWDEVIRKLAEEAMQRDKDKGMIIENPAGLLRYKMQRIRHQAEEDKGWLIRQRDRIMGSVPVPLAMLICDRCGASISKNVCIEANGKAYCDSICLDGQGERITREEWMRRLKRKGAMTGWREDEHGNRIEFTVTYQQAARTNPKVAALLDQEDNDQEDNHNDDEF